MLPEQVWDEADRPERFLHLGGPTGAAMPLAWAHAEYIKLIRSAYDGVVFDRIPAVADRYLGVGRTHRRLEIWKPSRQPKLVARGFTLRVQAPEAFLLHWSLDEWVEARETRSSPTALGIEFVDIPVAVAQLAPIRFTFRWLETGRWEGRDYEVATTAG
jgi:glucoamylase